MPEVEAVPPQSDDFAFEMEAAAEDAPETAQADEAVESVAKREADSATEADAVLAGMPAPRVMKTALCE